MRSWPSSRIGPTRGESSRLNWSHLRGADAVVLGIPRGGVVVAAEVARALVLPLGVAVVRKLGAPAARRVRARSDRGRCPDRRPRVAARREGDTRTARGGRAAGTCRARAADDVVRADAARCAGSHGDRRRRRDRDGFDRAGGVHGATRPRSRTDRPRRTGGARIRGVRTPPRSTSTSARTASRTSGPSGSSTTISRRRPMTRSSACSRAAPTDPDRERRQPTSAVRRVSSPTPPIPSARLWNALIEKSAPSRSATSSRSCSQMR